MSESQDQIKVVQWAKRQRKAHPEIRWLHAIPNGGKRHIAVASKMKLEGTEAGVLDLFLPVYSAKFNKHGLYIEMKFGDNTLSDNQKEFKAFVETQFFAVGVAYSDGEGINFLKKYLSI